MGVCKDSLLRVLWWHLSSFRVRGMRGEGADLLLVLVPGLLADLDLLHTHSLRC